MNISFYLSPKSEISYLLTTDTTGQALRHMKKHGYTAVPVVDQEGHYWGTISEGDFLWTLIHEYHKDLEAMDHKTIGSYKLKRDYKPVSIEADLMSLRELIINQNFVPVVDGRNVFIGIITRKRVICELIRREEEREKQ